MSVEILLANLMPLIPTVILSTVCAILAHRTRFTLLFTLAEGCVTLFVFCFLMEKGASMEEILLFLLILLTPSLLCKSKNGREKE